MGLLAVLLQITDAAGASRPLDIRTEHTKDPEIKLIIDYLRNGFVSPELSPNERTKFIDKAEKYFQDETGCLRFKMACLPGYGSQSKHNGPIVVPVTLRPLVVDYVHLSLLAGGHLSFKKVLHKTALYYWNTKSADLYSWTEACFDMPDAQQS